MKKTIWIALTSFVLGLLAATYIFVYLPEKKAPEPNLPAKTSPGLATNLFASPVEARPDLDFVKISEKVGPAVVKIVSQKVMKRNAQEMGGQDWPFEDFWERFFGRQRDREQEFRSEAQGSGFVISSDGYIITNNHIVEKAAKVTVTAGDQSYTAKVVGTDPRSDLALIKIEGKNLPSAELGDS